MQLPANHGTLLPSIIKRCLVAAYRPAPATVLCHYHVCRPPARQLFQPSLEQRFQPLTLSHTSQAKQQTAALLLVWRTGKHSHSSGNSSAILCGCELCSTERGHKSCSRVAHLRVIVLKTLSAPATNQKPV